MLKKLLPLTLAALLLAGGAACKSKKKPKLLPGELTEVQKAVLKKKALENYKKLVEKYPDTEHAAKAQERIKALAVPPKK